MALDLPVESLHKLIGNDGSEVIWPNLREPRRRRGIHVQECINAALLLGWSATPVELLPQIADVGNYRRSDYAVLFGRDWKFNWQRFVWHIKNSSGVIEGVGRNCNHAVAFCQGVIYDPDGDTYAYSRQACEERGFFTRCLWRVERRA
jgi:hypothetical protein